MTVIILSLVGLNYMVARESQAPADIERGFITTDHIVLRIFISHNSRKALIVPEVA